MSGQTVYFICPLHALRDKTDIRWGVQLRGIMVEIFDSFDEAADYISDLGGVVETPHSVKA